MYKHPLLDSLTADCITMTMKSLLPISSVANIVYTDYDIGYKLCKYYCFRREIGFERLGNIDCIDILISLQIDHYTNCCFVLCVDRCKHCNIVSIVSIVTLYCLHVFLHESFSCLIILRSLSFSKASVLLTRSMSLLRHQLVSA